jgi:hypothetical protein
MFQAPPREREGLTWFFFFLWVGMIFAAVPLAPKFLKWLGDMFPLVAIVYGTIIVILIATVIAVVYVFRKLRGRWPQMLWLVGTLMVFVYFCGYETKTPQEALHFLEYGFLGLLAFRALSHRIQDITVYGVAIAAVALVGTADEIVQWMTPGRYWDYHDVRFDAFSAALAQVVLAKGLRPPFISAKVPRSSVRRLCIMVMSVLLLLACCVLNTPRRVVWYADKIPSLEFLLRNEGIMTEFGHRHVDRDIGTFYSRYSIEDLLFIDTARGQSYGRRVADEFLIHSNINVLCHLRAAGTEPFLHEFASHMDRRDHYGAASLKYSPNNSLFNYHQTVAYRENQLLEKYYGTSLTNSGHVLPPAVIESWKSHMNTARPFRSPVSGHLITELRPTEVRRILLACILFVATCYVIWGREPRKAAKP